MSAALAFTLPPAREATKPPEARGVPRDGVRLLVADATTGELTHARFSELTTLLDPGDLLVVNVSATLPAALPARALGGEPVRVHVSTAAPALGPAWRVIEVRSADGSRPWGADAGDTLEIGADSRLEVVAPYASGARLLLARYDGPGTLLEHLAASGDPIRYGYVEHAWPLAVYQNVYATSPGSSEMPSAGRPFTDALITRLVAGGVSIAPITLHCGVSSPERHEQPFPEAYEVPAVTARQIGSTRRAGGRVIAVGTTVVRALESALSERTGTVEPDAGWTNLVIGPGHQPTSVDGMITGWHEPQASHLELLVALAGPGLIARSYDAALDHGYLWHEFGDSHLILRSGRPTS
jgi:S-adenosylmethionine:tRNA ribosyltransferase-isomerase